MVLVVLATLCQAPAQGADKRVLPPARFQTFTQPSGQRLPASGGVHLTGGMERPASAPPEVYNPGEPSLNWALARWQKEKMPILVWISPGYQLPDGSIEELKESRVALVFGMLQQPEPFLGVETASDWTPELNYVVAAGFETWRDLEREGIISFGFTDDPRSAQVLVFFRDAFRDSTEPGGNYVGGLTCAQLFTPEQTRLPKYRQLPVVMDLALAGGEDKLRARAAHEFGHALGIKEHSPYRNDLMYENNLVDAPSPSDKATLRYLYQQVPQYLM